MSETVTLSDDDLAVNIAPDGAVVAVSEVEPATAEVADTKDEKKTPWEQRRIAQITRQRHEAERRALNAENTANRLSRQLAAMQQPAEGENPPATEGLTKELFDQKVAEAALEQAFNTTCNTIYADGVEKFPDFQTKLEAFSKIGGLNPTIIEAAQEIGNPAKVLYDLAGDLDEAARILELSPIRMAAALSKLSASIAKGTGKVSRAAAPITPLTPGVVKENTDPEKMTSTEWRAWREAELSKKTKR